MSSRQKKRDATGGSKLGKDVLPMTQDRVIFECVSTVSDLIQRQMERFPQPSTKSNLSPRSSSQNSKALIRIPCEVKSSIRSLSEDTRSVFQSVTSLIKEKDTALDQISPGHSKKKVDKTETHVDNLKQHLGSLRTRLREVDQAEDGCDDKVPKWLLDIQSSTSGKSVNKGHGKQKSTSRANTQKGQSVLEQKLSSTYKAAQDLGASAGKTDSLRSLSKVLSELDALLAYVESGYDKSDAEDTPLREKREELLLSSGSDIGDKGGKLGLKKSSSSSVEAPVNPKSTNSQERNLSNIPERMGSRRSNKTSPAKSGQTSGLTRMDTRSENLKERGISKSPRSRGKNSDSVIPTNTAELVQKATPQCKNKTKKEHGDETVNRGQNQSPPTITQPVSVEKTRNSTQNKTQLNKPDNTPNEGSLSSIFSNDSLETNGDANSINSLLSNKSKSDTDTSVHKQADQKEKPGDDSNGTDLMQLNRRASVTDLRVCLETEGEPHLSSAELDMMPISTTSCPDISLSSTANHWPHCLKSSDFVQFSLPRHIKMASFLALIWIYIFIMAIFQLTTDISHAPFNEYATAVTGFVKRSIDIWYAYEPWF